MMRVRWGISVALAMIPMLATAGNPADQRKPSPETRFPRAFGYADIRTRYGATGDGKTDDTHAFQRALSEEMNEGAPTTVYVPNGVYLISGTVRWSRPLTLIGESREKTVLRLSDACYGFASKTAPKPLLRVEGPDIPQTDPHQPHATLSDLTLETGNGNPGAVGLDVERRDTGTVTNVAVRAGDRGGFSGVSVGETGPATGLFRNLRVEGFDVGITVQNSETSVTLSGLTLTGQGTAGIRNDSGAVAIEHLSSRNRIPAVVNRGGGQAVVIGAKLDGGAKDMFGVENFGAVYLRGVEANGYKGFLRDGGKEYRDRKTTEWVTSGGANSSLNLPLADSPEIPWGTPKEWANVRDFAEKRTPEGDWGPPIQAAIDSGAKTVYFPSGEDYRVDSAVHVRGNVIRLYGADVAITGGGQFLFDGNQRAVAVERLWLASARHESATDLIVRSVGITKLDAARNCGRLFLEDCRLPLHLNGYQRVWVRQLTASATQRVPGEPMILNDGGRLWVLGLRSEVTEPKIVNRNRAYTEILGGLVRLPGKPETPEASFLTNDNSDLSLLHLFAADASIPPVYLRWVNGIQTSETRSETLVRWVAGRPLIPLFTNRLTTR